MAQGLVLYHDGGSTSMSGDFQREIRFLGMTSLSAFVRQGGGNGVPARAIRALKEQLLWVRHLATVDELRLALAAFAALHNASRLREQHGHRTPDQSARSGWPLKPKPPRGSSWRHERRTAFKTVPRYT
ncbi:hypothetical protein [Paracoccus benzoatiresistens]|uniref:Uncharacterized protein n=1 Tax=Paracoccus benzoatiresistens TaxID=2997341 RepID=A0ABT4JBE2_9RHOB|nr:hypothetical protein [Paracoccus sp. EF6]MCZ0964458.1 hypothetical protein [Paracoccus sp. EF6]